MTGFLTTYRKIKGVWKLPKPRIFFGLWKNDPNLPVWRGTWIRLGKYGQYYTINKSVLLEDTKDYGDGYKHLYHSEHNVKQDYAWNRNIRRKLRKFGLGWVPPIIELPWWLSFRIFNWDVCWKWKYDDIRYEFPPQFTIVLFGVCLSITFHEPTGGYYTSDDQYWEGILTYLHKFNGNMYETVMEQGVWGWNEMSFFSIRPEHIERLEDFQEYCRAVEDYRTEHPEKNIV